MEGDKRQPLISVVMPMYNQEKYIRKCLESVIKQTLNELEIIDVNDLYVELYVALPDTIVDRQMNVPSNILHLNKAIILFNI